MNQLEQNYESAKKALGIANQLGGKHRSRAMTLLNKHRNEYLWHLRGGRAETHTPHFEMRIDGIPCGVVVTDDCREPQWNSFDFILVNARGYRMKWLEPRADTMEVFEVWERELERRKDERRIAAWEREL